MEEKVTQCDGGQRKGDGNLVKEKEKKLYKKKKGRGGEESEKESTFGEGAAGQGALKRAGLQQSTEYRRST